MKAVGLLSGGLDSTLAAKVLLEQGIEVYALNFTSPFCLCTPKNKGCAAVVTAVRELGGIPLKHVTLGDEYLDLVQHPRHGYGSGLNPCIDCRIMKIRKAGEYLREIGAAFVFTGEVLGQRPMSQHRAALGIIDRESGLEGLIVRPLSAQLFPPSIPEQAGWVDREKLLAFSGRSRKPQIDLAANYGIADYPCPAGGCLLTIAGFVQRLKDVLRYSRLNLHEMALLKVGRHFRLGPPAKLIVGRNQAENEQLGRLIQPTDVLFEPVAVNGPVGLGHGDFTAADIRQSARIMARYCDRETERSVEITSQRVPDGSKEALLTTPLPEAELEELRI